MAESSQEAPYEEDTEPQTETQKLKCEICGKEVGTSQALSSHIRNKHPTEQSQEPEIQTDEDRLRTISKRAGLASATESVVSIYFGENREGPEALNEVMRDLMVNAAKRRSVLRQFFQRPVSSLGIAELLDEESAKPKGPFAQVDEMRQRRLVDAEIKRLESQNEHKGSSEVIELQKMLADKDKQLADERSKFMLERLGQVERSSQESSQGVVATVNKTLTDIVAKFQDMMKEQNRTWEDRWNKEAHERELAKARAEGIAGERPIVTLAKTLDRGIREFPENFVSAYKKLPMFPQPQQVIGQGYGQLPQQLRQPMSEEEKLATAKRLAEKATKEAEEAVRQEQQAAQYRGYSEHNPFAAGGQR